MQNDWSKFPYQYRPKRDLKAKEVSQLLEHLFKLKVFPETFYEQLPDNLKEHFEKRENPEQPPVVLTKAKGNENA